MGIAISFVAVSYSKRIHLPWPINELEQFLQYRKQTSPTLNLELFMLGSRLTRDHLPHLYDQFVQDVNVHET